MSRTSQTIIRQMTSIITVKKMFALGAIVVVGIMAVAIQPVEAVDNENPQRIAVVHSTTDSPLIKVSNLQIDFRYKLPIGEIVGFYNPSDYPTVEYIPLNTGQKAKLSLLRKVVFTILERKTREFVPEEERGAYVEGQIDEEGYNSYKIYPLQATLTTLDGETFVGIVKLPYRSGIYLIGDTAIGEYELDLLSIKKPLTVEFGKK